MILSHNMLSVLALIILALKKLRYEGCHECKASLGYRIRSCLKKQNTTSQQQSLCRHGAWAGSAHPSWFRTVQCFVFFFFWSWSEPKEAFPGICASLLFLLKFPPTPRHIYTTWLLIYQVADVLFEYKTTPPNVILIMQKLTAITKMNIM